MPICYQARRSAMTLIAGMLVVILAVVLSGCETKSHGLVRTSVDLQEPRSLEVMLSYDGQQFGPFPICSWSSTDPPTDALPTDDVVEKFGGRYDILARPDNGACLDGEYQLEFDLLSTLAIPCVEVRGVSLSDGNNKLYAVGSNLDINTDVGTVAFDLIVHSGDETYLLDGTISKGGAIDGTAKLYKKSTRLIGSGVFRGSKSASPGPSSEKSPSQLGQSAAAEDNATPPAPTAYDVGYESEPPPPVLPPYVSIYILGSGQSVAYENQADCCVILKNQSTQAVLAKDVMVRLKVGKGLAIVWFDRTNGLGSLRFMASGMESWMKRGREKPENCDQLEDSFRASYEQDSVALERFRKVIDNEGFSCPRIASGSGANLDIKVKRTSEAPSEDSPESRNPLVVRLEAKPKGGAWSEITTAQYYY